MDKLSTYRQLITQHFAKLKQLIQQHPNAQSGVDVEAVVDREHDQYLLLKIGWMNGKRVRATTAYVRLREEKFWIEEDLTEDGIANHLLKAGVPHEDIVLAFQPPEARRFTEFAVA